MKIISSSLSVLPKKATTIPGARRLPGENAGPGNVWGPLSLAFADENLGSQGVTWKSRREGLWVGEKEKEDEGASSPGWELILYGAEGGVGGMVNCLGGAVSGPSEGPLGDKAGGSGS